MTVAEAIRRLQEATKKHQETTRMHLETANALKIASQNLTLAISKANRPRLRLVRTPSVHKQT